MKDTPSPAELWAQALLTWRRARRSFDARALKERRLMLVAALAVLWLLADTLWLTPAYKSAVLARTALSTAQLELATLQQQQAAQVAEGARMSASVQSDLAVVRKRLQDNSAAFAEVEQVLVPARQMRELLKGLLAEQQRLRLISMKTLPRTAVKLPPAQSGGTEAQLYRHGLEITVAGGFHDLLNWLLSIEHLPRKVLWNSLTLASDDQSRLSLTVSVQTLSRDADPMEIAP